MSKRETIAKTVIEVLEGVRYINNVTREPVSIETLSKNKMPHVYVETANEIRDHASFGDKIRRSSDLEILLNIVVMGDDRDSQRNLVIESIEQALDKSTELAALCYDSEVTDVQIREIDDSQPYAQAAIIYKVRYFYDKTKP